MPFPHLQCQYVFAGTGAGVLWGVSEVIVRKADLVTLVYCSLVCVVEDLQFPDLYRPQLPLLVSSLKRAALPLQKIHKLSRVLVLFVWSISSMYEI